jgi:hypothetical protein
VTVPSQISSRLLAIIQRRESIDQYSSALLPSRQAVFGAVSVRLPDVNGPAELAFIRTASWLYVHYLEVGRISVNFLSQRSSSQFSKSHINVVRCLRTWSQHNLDVQSKSDALTTDTCSDWFQRNCGTRHPRLEEHWSTLCECLLLEAQSLFDQIEAEIERIEGEDCREQVLRQWEDRLNRTWPAFRYHELIQIVAADLGRTGVDPVAFFQRYGATFTSGMTLLVDDCDFEVEARKLIEKAMLSEVSSVLPLTGSDVMQEFEMPPGPEVGQMMSLARSIYEQSPCDKQALLARLKVTRT